MRQFVVIGAGRFGRAVAITLVREGCQVLLLDHDAKRIQQMSELVTQAAQVDVTEEKALQSLDLGDMDVAVVSIGSDLEASILATMKLKEMGIKTVVAKAGSMAHSRILSRVGADMIVFPERDMAERIAKSLVSPTIFDYIEVSPGYTMMDIQVPDHLRGQTLGQANVRSEYGIDIVAIKRRSPGLDRQGQSELKEEVVIAPPASEVLGEKDVLVVIGEEEKINKFRSA